MDAQAHAVITEIDISQPARALWWLRLADYALVILCGLWALGLAKALLFEPASDGVLMVGFEWLSLAVLGWAIHSGQFEDIEAEGHRILQAGEDDSQDNVERHQE